MMASHADHQPDGHDDAQGYDIDFEDSVDTQVFHIHCKIHGDVNTLLHTTLDNHSPQHRTQHSNHCSPSQRM